MAAAAQSAYEPVKIELPSATLKQTLSPAMGLLSGKGSEAEPGDLAEASAAQGAQVLIAARWSAPLPGQVSYIFYVKGLEPGLRKGTQSRSGSMFVQTWLDAAGQPTHFPQPYALVKLNGELVYEKDAFAVQPPYKDIDELARLLQENVSVDLALGERRRLCSCGPAQFSLVPSLQLSNFRGQFSGYSGDLGLAVNYEKSSGGACIKSGCGEYVGIDIAVDQVTGQYLISDYHDGFLYAQYAAGTQAAANTGKDKQFIYGAHLRRAFALFNSLFAAGAHPDAELRKVIIESGKQGLLPGLSNAAAQKQVSAEFGSLNRKMTLERIKALRTAAALSPRSPMAHAGLGILLSRECTRQLPLAKDSCENGIRELLKARELAPELALPAYVLLNRAESQFFPARLRRLLNEDAATVCAKFKNSVPAWDWAFYSVCATAVKTDKEKAGEYLRAAQGIAVIRPKDLLLRYLDLELAAQ